MAKDKVTIVVPNEDMFGPAEIPFGVVSGPGVPDFDNRKSKGKRGGLEYTVTLKLGKKEDKQFRKDVMEFWEANKPKDGGDKPANFKNLTREDKDDENIFLLYPKSKTEFEVNGETIQNTIPIVNQEGTKLDPEEFGSIGNGSEGRVAVTLRVYGDDEDAGVSVFLAAVKLTKFVARDDGSATYAFGTEDGEVEGEGGFKAEKKNKDKDKKKKNKKNNDQDEE